MRRGAPALRQDEPRRRAGAADARLRHAAGARVRAQVGRMRGSALHRHADRRAEAAAEHQGDAHDHAAARQQGQVLRPQPHGHPRPRQLHRRGGGGGAGVGRDGACGGRGGGRDAQHGARHPPGVPGAPAHCARHQQDRPADPGAEAAAGGRLLQAQARHRGGEHGGGDLLGPQRHDPLPAPRKRVLRVVALRLLLHPRLLRPALRRHLRGVPGGGAGEAAVGRLLVRRGDAQVQEEPAGARVAADVCALPA
mmetsp:Transcript_58992/g.123213  ORF Transcript_58992/g.123213 Transcript_58992/m.123213 type:complete len:252 (+) Transcript_58992:408-1163(+)